MNIFERRLWARCTRNSKALMRAMREKWKMVDLGLCKFDVKDWLPRVKKMLNDNGYQLE
jgi:hypothetical protein